MQQTIFSGTVDVRVSGNGGGLTLQVVHLDYAEYNLMSFNKPVVYIRDYRNCGIKAIVKFFFLEQITIKSFWRCFCSPATVLIEANDKRELIITLRETSYDVPDNVLWAAIGIEKSIPLYDYCLVPWVSEIDNNHIGLLSVYRKRKPN